MSSAFVVAIWMTIASPVPLTRPQAEAIERVAIKRLYADFVRTNKQIKVVAITTRVGDKWKSPSSSFLKNLHLGRPIIQSAALDDQRDMAYVDFYNPKTKKPCAWLEIDSVRAVGHQKVEVVGTYLRSGFYTISKRYQLTRTLSGWKVTWAGPMAVPSYRILTGKNGSHTFRVIVRAITFNPKLHRIRQQGVGGCTYYEIDGQEPVGAEFGTPNDELASFAVMVDGKRIGFPRKLWRDLFEADLATLKANVSADGNRLWLSMVFGPDDDYQVVTWNLYRYGRSTRRVGEQQSKPGATMSR